MASGSVDKRQKPAGSWKKAYLAALAITGNHTVAAEAAGVLRQTAMNARKRSPKFETECQQAIEQAIDMMEEEARRRAFDGLQRKKFHAGEPVTDPETGEQYTEREYSDSLASLILKAKRAREYGEKSEVRHTGRIEVVFLNDYDDDEPSEAPGTDASPKGGPAPSGAG